MGRYEVERSTTPDTAPDWNHFISVCTCTAFSNFTIQSEFRHAMDSTAPPLRGTIHHSFCTVHQNSPMAYFSTAWGVFLAERIIKSHLRALSTVLRRIGVHAVSHVWDLSSRYSHYNDWWLRPHPPDVFNFLCRTLQIKCQVCKT